MRTRFASVFWLFVFCAGIVQSAPTPLDAPLPEEAETEIACDLTVAPKAGEVPVLSSAKDALEALGSYHYRLWLPKGYAAEPSKRWPCIFIMSPGGRATMQSMKESLKGRGFVVVMLVEAKNGPWGPIVGNFLAAHDDVAKRVRIDPTAKYATGFSGGA